MIETQTLRRPGTERGAVDKRLVFPGTNNNDLASDSQLDEATIRAAPRRIAEHLRLARRSKQIVIYQPDQVRCLASCLNEFRRENTTYGGWGVIHLASPFNPDELDDGRNRVPTMQDVCVYPKNLEAILTRRLSVFHHACVPCPLNTQGTSEYWSAVQKGSNCRLYQHDHFYSGAPECQGGVLVVTTSLHTSPISSIQ
jgi:hypothetical protein